MLGQELPCVTIDERDLPRLSNGDQSLREMLAHEPRRLLSSDKTSHDLRHEVRWRRGKL